MRVPTTMTRSSRVARLLLAATFVMAAMGAWAAPAAAEEPAPDRSTQQFEIRFMEFTIEHHLMGVEMAELCMEKTTPPPPEGDATLVERCAVIAEDQAQEAQMLQDWLRDWYGVEFEPKMSSGQLNKLIKAEGEEFDIEVAGMFIEHHLRQIKESQKCLERAFHEELLDLCQHMIAEQSANIIVFRDILQQHGEDFRN